MNWGIAGNSGTDPNVNFLGTVDKQPLVVKTNAEEVLRFEPDGKVGIGTTNPVTKLEIVKDWDEEDGGLRLSGDKPTIRFTGGPILATNPGLCIWEVMVLATSNFTIDRDQEVGAMS